ncbi:MAG: 30S ribosomal protein S16 [Candidatus Nanopelagicales bacterium]|nr:30S ribosomal protein S16 [Candidatus Nanopelagicales bacterium]
MAVKIKLKRMGKTRNPQYRIVIADSRTARGGRAIEEIGVYQPRQEPSLITVDSERVQYWLGVGAQPTEPVLAILKVTGDWQRFKGEPGAEGTLRVAEPKADKRMVFEAAVRSAEEAGKASKPKPPRAERVAPKESVEVPAPAAVVEPAAAQVSADELAGAAEEAAEAASAASEATETPGADEAVQETAAAVEAAPDAAAVGADAAAEASAEETPSA